MAEHSDYTPALGPALDALYAAWVVIANAYGGDWSKADPKWRRAAERWRDQHFHPVLAAHREANPALMVQNHPPRWMDHNGEWHEAGDSGGSSS